MIAIRKSFNRAQTPWVALWLVTSGIADSAPAESRWAAIDPSLRAVCGRLISPPLPPPPCGRAGPLARVLLA